MIILPAIDLLDGQVVRLRQGKPDQRTVYPEDALFYACAGKKKAVTACMWST